MLQHVKNFQVLDICDIFSDTHLPWGENQSHNLFSSPHESENYVDKINYGRMKNMNIDSINDMLRNPENIQSTNVCKDTVDKIFSDTANIMLESAKMTFGVKNGVNSIENENKRDWFDNSCLNERKQ